MTDRVIPETIKNIVQRCEANEVSFKNDDMSVALLFGQAMWCRIVRLAEYYEKVSGNFMPDDVRASCFADAAKDLRGIQDDVIGSLSISE
jgi:hypothetical protein